MRINFYFIELFILNVILVLLLFIEKSPLTQYPKNSFNNQLFIVSDKTNFEFDSLVIPLKRAGNLLLVEAKIDNQTGNLIFDTGASGLVLNKTYFRSYAHFDSNTPSGITGSIGTVYSYTTDSLEINELIYRNVKADIADLGHIENKRGIKVLGLFGFNLLRDYEIVIDVQNSELILYSIDKKGNRKHSNGNFFISDCTQEIRVYNNILFLMATVGGKMLNFCFDTGAEINAISNGLQSAILNTISITRRTKLGGAGSNSSEVLYGIMNDFSIGSNSLENMQTIVTNLSHLEEAYDTNFSGILGYDFLEKGTICINIRKREMGIRFNTKKEI